MRNSQDYGGDNCATGGSSSRRRGFSQDTSSSRGVSTQAAGFRSHPLIHGADAGIDGPIASARRAPQADFLIDVVDHRTMQVHEISSHQFLHNLSSSEKLAVTLCISWPLLSHQEKPLNLWARLSQRTRMYAKSPIALLIPK